MLKKTIKFKDLDNNEVEEDFYFNLNPAEIAELELSERGGLASRLRAISATQEPGKILAAFKDIVSFSVGRRSDDGRRFIKNDQIRDEFFQSEAWSEMFLEFFKDVDSGIAFITGIIPPDLAAKISAEVAAPTTPASGPHTGPAEELTMEQLYDSRLRDPKWQPSPGDFQHMTQSQIAQAFARKQNDVAPAAPAPEPIPTIPTVSDPSQVSP